MWALGPQALRTANLLRDLLSAQALALRAAWVAGENVGTTADWLAAAARLAYPSRWLPPRPTRIADLWGHADEHAGTQVTVQGVIGQLVNAHVRNKVVSSAWISDAQGVSVRIGITHIKLDSGGLVPGAYAEVTGEFVPFDKDFKTPVVRIGRRALQNDSEHAWEDWALLQTRHAFTAVPHNLTMSWTWQAGVTGAANQLRYGSWLPFERGGT
jgi:hypothetical protein